MSENTIENSPSLNKQVSVNTSQTEVNQSQGQPDIKSFDVQNLQVSSEQAKQVAEQVAGGVMQGVDKLKQTGFIDLFKKAENQKPVTMEEKLWAGISYVPLVALVALVIKPDSDYIKLHGRQGLLIFLFFFFCIFVYLVPFVGPLFAGLLQFALFILGLFSMYQAFIGNWWKIPILGDLATVIPLSMFVKVTQEVITGQATEQSVANADNDVSVKNVDASLSIEKGQNSEQSNQPPSQSV